MYLSVVLISKNQAWNISRLINSVIEEINNYDSTEIILVDSASTDRTTEIAAQFPIKVLKLHPGQHLSASAGRYVGIKNTSGNFILFLDGDMELCHGWLDKALEILEKESKIGVVCGRVVDRPIDMKSTGKQRQEMLPIDKTEAIEVLQSGGASLYRRSILENVATFNPYLFSEEEPSLCLQIRMAGYKIIQLPQPIVYHYSEERNTLFTVMNKQENNIWLGFGQNLRYFLGKPLFWRYLRERGWVISPTLVVTLGLITLFITIITGNLVFFSTWLTILLIITIILIFQKRSLKLAFLILLRRWLILKGTIRGFLLEPYEPENYPGKFDLLREF